MQERTASSADAGKRLDHFLKDWFPRESRALVQQWIKAGRVWINGQTAKASSLLREGDRVAAEPAERPPLRAEAEELPLEILYEDEAVVAVNKPAGMVVHAGAGVHSGTLVNALLHHLGKNLSETGGPLRPGIVHRLDRFTSGVLLVARSDAAHQHLAAQFAGRRIEKTYLALVEGGVAKATGLIDKPIARDPDRRVRMTVRLGRGRSALTTWELLRRYERYSLLSVKIGTGRTHQIRVHLSSIGHPVVGDKLYGAAAQPRLGRYFLHAWRIRFVTPATGAAVEVEAPLPPELEAWLAGL